MAEPLFDDQARALRRARAAARQSSPFLAERIVEDLVERLAPVRRPFGRALVTGVPAALQHSLRQVADEVRFAPSIDHLAEVDQASHDLLLTVGELDLRDELPLLLRIAHSRIAPGGLFVGALVGGQSLPALRAALHAADAPSGSFPARTHPRIEPGAFAGLLAEAGFAEPVVDVDRVRLRYRSLGRLVDDLRDHGATNILRARPRAPLGRESWVRAQAAFAEAAVDGTTEERIELLHFAAWVPADNKRA